jgi:uncharacterized protein
VSGAGVGLYTWLVEPHWLEIVRRPLPIRGLPAALRGRTLAQLTDIHVGPRVSDAYLSDVFTRVASLAPDIVVYTGDFTSYHANVFAHVMRVYRDAPRGRLATFGILGNHDYGPNWAHPEVAARLAMQLEASGIRVLRNEVAEVDGLQIGGMLSGHTHGGQCKPPFLPPPLLPVQNRRYTCGEFELPGDRRLYISRGVGHLLQVRINVWPEVTLFELT